MPKLGPPLFVPSMEWLANTVLSITFLQTRKGPGELTERWPIEVTEEHAADHEPQGDQDSLPNTTPLELIEE